MNYLRPDIKRGNITPDEDDLIIRLHSLLGNRWSLIAGRLPGRTDNEIKNYWNTHLSKKLRSQGTHPSTHKELAEPKQPAVVKKRKATKPHGQVRRLSAAAVKSGTGDGEVMAEKPKLHLPKAIRVTSSFPLPRNDSFKSNMGGGSTSSKQGSGQTGREVARSPCTTCNHNSQQNGNGGRNGVEFMIGEGEMGLESLRGGEGSLEKLYEEYLELLRTGQDHDLVEMDCFAESLLI